MDKEKSDNIKPSYWYCDRCERVINHGELRYNCTICDNYDYCEQCVATAKPPHPHAMVPELAYGQEESKECMKVDIATALRAAIAMYWDRHCLGTRDRDQDDPSIYKDSYSWLTFKTIGDRAKNFGHGLRQLINPRQYLAICAANRPEWVIADFACVFQSIISVPIYTLFTDREMIHVLNNTKISVIVCDGEMLSRFVGIRSECPNVEHIVCMDPIPDELLTCASDNKHILHSMNDVEKNGLMKPYEYVEIGPSDPLTIIYTSGSSGFPKGAIISEGAFRATFPRWFLPSSLERVTFSYRPLVWAADRDAIITTFLCGGRTGFYTGDTSRLMEELALVRPTYFGSPPAIWNKIYTEFKTALVSATVNSLPEETIQTEQHLLQQFSKLIPNRCRSIAIGGAMVSPAVLNFMKRCFTQCTVYESYGITECGSVTLDNLTEHTIEFRLESVSDMGYTTDDKPYPRGELLTKTPQMFSGYINNPDETKAALTEDGFFRTGDIVELQGNQGSQFTIHIIDRKKNFFKLSQGQFVSPEYLQSIYIQSPFVEQIYIHGDLLSHSVSAVIVPNLQYAQSFAQQHHLPLPLDFDLDHPHPLFYQAIQQDLQSIAKKEALRTHEIPSHIVIDFHPFTPENGLLTSTYKLCRHKIAVHYAQQLANKHNTIEQQLRSIIETVTQQNIAFTDDQHSNSILMSGADSLSAIRLSRMIEHDLGVTIPTNVLFDPQMTLAQLTSLIQHPSQLASLSHSIAPQLTRDANADLNIVVHGHKSTLSSHPSVIFITGTTGFVGAFLLAELLRVYPSTSRFVCLVRCTDGTSDVVDRVRQNLSFYQIWKDEYEHRISAVRGDLSKCRLGIVDEHEYNRLASEVDVIYHCGATVNFVLPYHLLYGANVNGTREIIRLATHHSDACIPIHYISTISVVGRGSEAGADELVGGYAQSKWVAEKMVSGAIKCGVRAVIYRLGLMCADSENGGCNVHDVYTMLFREMMKMKCYRKSWHGGRMSGLPVDCAMRSVVCLSDGERSSWGSTHDVMDAESEVMFEEVVSGMEACGIKMEGVSDDEWKRRLNKESGVTDSIKEELFANAFRQNEAGSSEQFSASVSSLELPPMNKDYLKKWFAFILKHLVNK
ncbi:unnamed protein product [Adineta ricciae]|uniref:long-chain-fatty-acid--CoA ligase n=1 Tax=Adineta ricciae TaxID=249248 RepID=A0A816B713_ADIRI|nr:unnamed protein product [Adineta ricciae]